MEMHQVRYFLAVADELNFSRAAEKCNVSQPSLSRAIQLLEREFGGQLFRREYSRTHLSLGKDAPNGRAIQRHGRIEGRPMLGGLHHQYVRV